MQKLLLLLSLAPLSAAPASASDDVAPAAGASALDGLASVDRAPDVQRASSRDGLALDAARSTPGPRIRAGAIPPRAAGALTGSEFGWLFAEADDPARRAAVLSEVLSGNVPDFLRELIPLHLDARGASGRSHQITLWVTPDYLAVGSDEDYLRVPMDLPSAVRVADRFGFLLPTPLMVDAIYEQAELQLTPAPQPPTDRMRTIAYTLQHRALIAPEASEIRPGALLAGHKKDVVLTGRLIERPDRVAIYGWHQPSGEPIQTLSLWHGALYADYSHGIRLVHETAWVDGQPRSLYDLLRDPELAPALSEEGPIDAWRAMHPDLSLAHM